MFTFREIISGETQERNVLLGNSYIIVRKENSTFNYLVEKVYGFTSIDDMNPKPDIFAFVVSEDNRMFPLYNVSHNYIINDNGSTFSKIKNKLEKMPPEC